MRRSTHKLEQNNPTRDFVPGLRMVSNSQIWVQDVESKSAKIVSCSRNPKKNYGNLISGNFQEDLHNEAIHYMLKTLLYTLAGTH